jgi:hypothetical protein
MKTITVTSELHERLIAMRDAYGDQSIAHMLDRLSEAAGFGPRPAWQAEAGTDEHCPNGPACTVHPRPVDTFLRSAEERAWVRQHGMLAWGRPGDSASADREYAALRTQAQRDYQEMRRITGTRDDEPVPYWY